MGHVMLYPMDYQQFVKCSMLTIVVTFIEQILLSLVVVPVIIDDFVETQNIVISVK